MCEIDNVGRPSPDSGCNQNGGRQLSPRDTPSRPGMAQENLRSVCGRGPVLEIAHHYPLALPTPLPTTQFSSQQQRGRLGNSSQTWVRSLAMRSCGWPCNHSLLTSDQSRNVLTRSTGANPIKSHSLPTSHPELFISFHFITDLAAL